MKPATVHRAAIIALYHLLALGASAQTSSLRFLNDNKPILDAHNCYPYDGRWNDRIDRALKLGFPIAIEQDLAWVRDSSADGGRVVVAHGPETTGAEPTLRDYFFERVRPIIQKALAENHRSSWPLIVVHFDVKDNREPLLRSVWKLLGEYESWISTAVKTADAHQLSELSAGPLLVLTEDSDEQQRIFYDELPVGTKLRIFGSAHTFVPRTKDRAESIHLATTLAPDQLLREPATNYRRWWNNSWYAVEEGGQQHAGAWTSADNARLRSLVERAHQLGYWIRFYTLDGFAAADGKANGWFETYNFGSPSAAAERWRAAIEAGVNLIATDEYEALARTLHRIE